MKTTRILVAAAGALGLIAIGACSSEAPRDGTPLSEGNETVGDNALDNSALPPPAEAITVDNSADTATTTTPPPADPVEDTTQMRDDADASGMTAKLPPPEDTAPVEETKVLK